METSVNLRNELVRISTKTGFSSLLLEKDYFLTKILQHVSIPHLIFKGGTCLNKCYLGFYRLSEDLDFVMNENWDSLSKTQAKKRVSILRDTLFEILKSCDVSFDTELGKGWKMITSGKIIRLEIIGEYVSVIDNSKQRIKIEVSFYYPLYLPTTKKVILHEFYDALNEPFLSPDIEIECISLEENLAEKYRALVTRPSIAIRDLYDICVILEHVSVDISLILQKINEVKEMSKEEFVCAIQNLSPLLSTKPLEVVLKRDSSFDIQSMITKVQGGIHE